MMKASARPCTPNPTGRWRMLELRASGMRVVIPVDDAVEVLGDLVGDLEQLVVVETQVHLAQTSGIAMEARLQTATSSFAVYSMISVQRLEERIVPRFCWLDLPLAASLYSM